jgi:MinD-like ATPase involved in chromosome partitioning or flagellar assembly
MIITERIKTCRKDQPYEVLTVVGRIPLDPIFKKAMVQGQTIFEYNTKSEAEKAVEEIWKKLSIFWKYKNIKQLCLIRTNKKIKSKNTRKAP